MSRTQKCFLVIALFFVIGPVASLSAQVPFRIQVVDEQTGRGVPLVELRTVSNVAWWTDSAGLVAFDEPGLMGQEVYFHVRSHGYELPKDGFSNRGLKLKPVRGGSATIKLKRINVAERLYRLTGEGIYRDSILLGEKAPIEQPLLNGQICGQDGTHAVPYRGKIYWLWGDTQWISYPLGNFRVSGATSEWPAPRGSGLDPSAGVNLKYFVDEKGFSRPMVPQEAIPGPGAVWQGGVTTIRDEQGKERLIASYVRLEALDKVREQGIMIYNDKTEGFERLKQFDLGAQRWLVGKPFHAMVDGVEYIHSAFAAPCSVRVRADLKHVTDPAAYEGFTCLVAGTKYDGKATQLDRRADGSLNYAWKASTWPLNPAEQSDLIKAGKMKPEEAWMQLTDIETAAPIRPHASSIQWNDYRKRWVMIVEQAGGSSSVIGEIWYAEADTPIGPWVYARKVVTHDKQSFYNPNHLSFFDQDGGRLIYFDGTYSADFSGNPEKTPRYEYNLIVYRLSLDDERLSLPAPVYRVKQKEGASSRLMMREDVEAENLWKQVEEAAFFAVPSARSRPGLVPIFATTRDGHTVLQAGAPPDATGKPIFFALPATNAPSAIESVTGPWHFTSKIGDGNEFSFDLQLAQQGAAVEVGSKEADTSGAGTFDRRKLELKLTKSGHPLLLTGELRDRTLSGEWKQLDGDARGDWSAHPVGPPPTADRSPAVVALYEYERPNGQRIYSTNAELKEPGVKRKATPLCSVWRNPMAQLILDPDTQPVKRTDAPARSEKTGESGVGNAPATRRARPDAPPNVVMILGDDQAWPDFGFMRSKDAHTPNLDRLASQSAVFTRGYVPTSVCTPSLASIITGQYPHVHRLGIDLNGLELQRPLIEETFRRHPSLPSLLASKGYASLQTGKWWHGDCRLAGFTQCMTTGKPIAGSKGIDSDELSGGKGLGPLDKGLEFLMGAEGLRIGRETMQPIYDFVRNRGERPFFIWYAPMMPHTPHNPPLRLLRKYQSPERGEPVAKYMAMCEWFDETVGDLLTFLDKEGLTENTLVIYAVDNGYIPLPKSNWFDERSKLSPYDGGVRTPIVVRWPRRIRPARYETLAQTIDLAPTVLAACGAGSPAGLPGINLLDVCDGRPVRRDAVFGATFGHKAEKPSSPADTVSYRWCIVGEWKLIVPRDTTSKQPELYNIVADPREARNRAAEQPDRVKALREKLDEWWPGRSEN